MGQFNSDTNALINRADLNSKNAKYDLEDWIIESLPNLQGIKVLDLGCGTGKQIFKLAPHVTFNGQILGIDISYDAINSVNEQIRKESISYIEAIQMNIDDSINKLSNKCFDLIISSYAIYYSNNQIKLINDLKSLLSKNGTIFVCGPGYGTNIEIYDIVNLFTTKKIQPLKDFIDIQDIQEIGKKFSSYKISRLENKILFDSPEKIIKWWHNHNSFDVSIAPQVEDYIKSFFSKNNNLELTKNVLGVRFDAWSI